MSYSLFRITSSGPAARAGWPLMLMVLVMLGGCAQGSNIADLQEYVSDLKSKKGRIEELPSFDDVEGFVYAANSFKDPFITWETEIIPLNRQSADQKGPRPDSGRKKEPLEQFSLASLRMVGVLGKKDKKWALVKASDGVVYKVRAGNYIGQNHGRVIRVEDSQVVLVEIISNGLGGWEERETVLELPDSE